MELVHLLEGVPAAELTTAMNTIRQTIGVGLDILNPQAIVTQFRSGYSHLAELAPANLLGTTLSMPALKLSFTTRASAAPPARQADVLAVSARFDAVFAPLSPAVSSSQMQQLVLQHRQLLGTLRQRINALEGSTVAGGSSPQQNYAQLKRSLDKLLPSFLRQPLPLTHAEIIAGFYAMRPSSKAQLVEQALERFLQLVEPYEAAIETGINAFFNLLREIIEMLNPLSVRDSVAAIYTTIRDKVQVIDPQALRQDLTALMNTLTAPLAAINPSQIAAQLNGVYNSALAALTTQVNDILDNIVDMVDTSLRAIRAAIHSLLDQVQGAITAILEGLQGVLDRVEGLIFVEILGRLGAVIDNLGMSFDAELDRVRLAFDAMLGAIPLESSASVSVGV
jgi:hypothetical protein